MGLSLECLFYIYIVNMLYLYFFHAIVTSKIEQWENWKKRWLQNESSIDDLDPNSVQGLSVEHPVTRMKVREAATATQQRQKHHCTAYACRGFSYGSFILTVPVAFESTQFVHASISTWCLFSLPLPPPLPSLPPLFSFHKAQQI